jgi:cysteine desulfurase
MLELMQGFHGNPSSSHSFGQAARSIVEKARADVAGLLCCRASEIIFTSGGTESNNLAILGALEAASGQRKHVICSAVEHPSVRQVCTHLSERGYGVTVLPVDCSGLVDPDELQRSIEPGTVLISVMHANNEVGTVQPVRELAAIAADSGVLFHTDAAQSAGKIDISATGADLLSLAGHKIYGPKGTGVLYVKEGVSLCSQMHGAGHERGLRPGTENVLGIAGIGVACRIARMNLENNSAHMMNMRDRLHLRLSELAGEDGIRLNGHPDRRLPNTLSLGIRGVRADVLMRELRDLVALSAGAACHGDGISLSPVLEAMNVPLEWAAGTIRMSTGRETTPEEVDEAAAALMQAIGRIETGGRE